MFWLSLSFSHSLPLSLSPLSQCIHNDIIFFSLSWKTFWLQNYVRMNMWCAFVLCFVLFSDWMRRTTAMIAGHMRLLDRSSPAGLWFIRPCVRFRVFVRCLFGRFCDFVCKIIFVCISVSILSLSVYLPVCVCLSLPCSISLSVYCPSSSLFLSHS